MKKNLCFFAVTALALVSCDEEVLVNNQVAQSNKVLTASFEQEVSSTRVNIAADNGLSWSAGDAIAVFESEAPVKYNYKVGTNGDFEVDGDNIPQNIIGSAFPYSEVVSLEDDALTMNLPASYDQATLSELDMPMWGTIEDNNITFKHLAGVLKVNLEHVPQKFNTLIVTASNPISGTFTADITEDNPVLTSKSILDKDMTVSVKFVGGNDVSLFLPLPVGTYASIVVSIASDDETMVLKHWAGNTVERAKIYSTTVSDYSFATVYTEKELMEYLVDGREVVLGGDIEVTGENYPEGVSANGFTKEAYLILNGHTLTYTGNDVIFRVASGGNIFIDGTKEGSQIITNPTNPSEKGGNGYVALVQEGGVVTFNGGNYVLENTCTVAQSNGGYINVLGGTYDAQKETDSYERGTYTFNCKDEYAEAGKIRISGGTFMYFDPERNSAEDPKISFVLDGYISKKIGEHKWQVVPNTENN